MKIDVWSDVICPWCWLGKARLDKALASFSHASEVRVVFRSFELDPRSPKDLDIPTNDMLQKKFGVGPAQIDAMHARLRALGEADGIDFRFDKARTSNTFLAHQLIHLARAHGKEALMVDRLFRANFHDGIRVGEREQLLALASEVGLDGADARAALDEDRYADAVRADEEQAHARGISGVPFVMIDGRIGISGAQPVELVARALREAWSKRGASVAGGEVCEDDGCK